MNNKERRSLKGVGIFGSCTIILQWILSFYGIDMTVEVSQAFTVIFSVLGGWIANKV